MTLVLILLFLVLLVMGLPIAVCLGLSSGVVIVVYHLPVAVLAQRMVNALDSTPLLAVPLFIFAANLLSVTGVTRHLFELVRLMVGRLRGGVAHVSILVSLIFSGISGAALADIGALGGIQIRMMREQGYKDEFAAGITMAAATIGPIFPPSIPLIIFASVANISAVKLLLAGIVPALIIAVLLIAQVAIMAHAYKLPRDTVAPTLKAIATKFVVSIPALAAPVILIGGLMSGLFGPTEVAGVTVLYAMAIGIFLYRDLSWAKFVHAARETVEATGAVLFIVAAAALFAWVLTIDRVPLMVSAALSHLHAGPVLLLLLLNVLLLAVGMIMELIAAILIIAPIITPPLVAAGIDPLQLGIVFVLNLMIGLLTPPVGMSLYMVSIITKMPLHSVVRGVLPFLIPLLLSLLAVTLVPESASWLPNLVMK